MSTRGYFPAAFCASLVLLAPPSGSGGLAVPKTQPRYSVTDLGTLPGVRFSRAFKINDKGQVIGESGHAFVWESGTMTDIGTLGGPRSTALAINDQGQIVGDSDTGRQIGGGSEVMRIYHSFLWQNGKMVSLHPLSVRDINNKGQIAGTFFAAEEARQVQPVAQIEDASKKHPRAFVRTADRQEDLGLLDGTTGGSAISLNNNGQVVGSCRAAGTGNSRAFLWQIGKMTALGTLPGGENLGSDARDINDKGQVVGGSWRPPGPETHAFLWNRGRMFDLGTLGGVGSVANAINNAGQVVGSANAKKGQPGSAWPGHAFLWQNGKMIDLNHLIPAKSAWELQSAMDINDRGQIVGTGKRGGEDRAFLLTPLPPRAGRK